MWINEVRAAIGIMSMAMVTPVRKVIEVNETMKSHMVAMTLRDVSLAS